MAARPQTGGEEGVSVQTLLIAALASAGAAVIVSQFWASGTVMAAAITPVIVSLLREAVLPKAIDRPARALSEVRAVRRTTDVPPVGAWAGYTAAAGAGSPESRPGGAWGTPHGPPPTEALTAREPGLEDLDPETGRLEDEALLEPETEPLDPATRRVDGQTRPLEGETQPLGGPPPVGEGLPLRAGPTERPPRADDLGPNGRSAAAAPVPAPSSARRRLHDASRRPRIRLAVITGVLAFVIAAVVLTVPELIAGGSVGGGSGRTTLFSGGGSEDSRQGDGAEDGVIDGGGAESPGGGDGDGGGEDPEPTPGGGDGSPEPEEPSGEQPGQNRRSIERQDQSDQPPVGGSGASRSQGQRAPAKRAAPSSPSGGGASP